MDSLLNAGVIALATFILGLLATGITYMFAQYRKRCSIRRTIISWLEVNRESLLSYADSLQKLYQGIETSDQLTHIIYESNSISVQRINEFSVNELNDALVQSLSGKENKDYKSKVLFKLLRNIEFLEEMQNYIQEHYKDYVARTNKELDKWEEGFGRFTHFMETTRYLDLLTDADRMLIKQMDVIGFEFAKEVSKEPHNPKFTRIERFVKEFQSIIYKCRFPGQVYGRLIYHLDSISSSYLAFCNIKDYSLLFKTCYEKIVGNSDVAGNGKGAIKNLEECVEFYRKRKIKFWRL